ncbi:MAG: outer membrane protein assembly factor BamD [Acidobacteriota bacterium]|nr:outer membrane protein assembly factor BamD [Acidobacteriota bacterium]
MLRLSSSSRLARRALPLAVLVIALGAAACAGRAPINPPADAPEPDKYLYDQGMAQLGNKKWLTAREYLRRLVDGYPQSTYRADAKLAIGDTFLGENTPEAQVYALNEFREFLTFFPTHARADYAQFRLAMSHYQQMNAPQRDQTNTRDAIREFEAFVERYPASKLRPDVEAKLRDARDRVGRADYEVGLHYYRMKWYPGAIDRFTALLERDPKFSDRDAVYFYMGEILSAKEVNRAAEALPYYDRIVKEFEKSEYLERAVKRIAAMKAGPGKI